MRWDKWKQGITLMVLAAGMGMAQSLHGVEPRRPVTLASGESSKIVGKVEVFLKNEHGDVDGVRLRGGQESRFPPHIGREVQRGVEVGDRIEIVGRSETRPRGETVFEAARIDVGGKVIEVDRPRPPHGPGARRASETPMSAEGVVDRFTQAPKGETDGFLLADGTEVRFPPHQSDELRRMMEKGDRVRVEGRRHETPRGEVHLHADRIVAVATGNSIDRDEPGRRGPTPRMERPEPSRAAEVTNEEILKELRSLRRWLEERK